MDYLRVAFVFAPQLLAGCLIYLLILKRHDVHLVELLSMGSAIGITTSTICDQIFVNLNYPRIGWILPLIISIIVGSCVFSVAKMAFAKIIWRGELKNTLFPVIAIATMALGTEWFWLFPSGVLLVIATTLMHYSDFRFRTIAIRTSLVLSLITLYFMISSRPIVWWMLEEGDYPFFAALSNALAKGGIANYPLASGFQVKYHWFVYAWVGLTQRVTLTPPFFSLTIVAPVIFSLAITGLVWTIIAKFSKSKSATFYSTLIVMVSSSFPLWGGGMKVVHLGSPSQFYAFLFLFAAIALLLEYIRKNLRFSVLSISIISMATVLSKTMHGIILSIFLISLVIFFITIDRKNRVFLWEPLVALGAIFFAFLLLIKMPTTSSFFDIGLGEYAYQLQGDLRTMPIQIISLVGVINIVGLTVLSVVLLFDSYGLGSHGYSEQKLFLYSSLVIIAAIYVMSFLLLGDAGENLYFLHSGVATVNLFMIATISAHSDLNAIDLRKTYKLIITGIGLALTTFLIPNFNSGSPTAVLLRAIRTPFGAVIIGLGALSVAVSRIRRGHDHKSIVTAALVVTVSMSITFTVINWGRDIQRKHNEYASVGLNYLGSSDLIEVGNWIRLNTPSDSIIASNYGWGKLEVSELGPHSSPCTALRDRFISHETCKRTTDAKLVVYMERQAWLQATMTIWLQATQINSFAKNESIATRQLVSTQFAKDPSVNYARILHDSRIDWFVVDRTDNLRTSWQPFAEIRFTNDSFFVLELDSSQ